MPANAVLSGAHGNGRAENAPLIRMCVPLARFGLKQRQIEPGDVFRMMHEARVVAHIATVTGLSRQNDDVEFATLWAELSDCIYRQNGWMLCNADNRALAAEAVNTFVRQLTVTSRASTSVDPRTTAASLTSQARNRDYLLRSAEATRTRVMSSLRQHVAEGRLTASDFGMFAPAEVLQAVRETKVMRNSCEARI